jgi:hypothetical protein
MKTPVKGFACLQDISMDHNKRQRGNCEAIFLFGENHQHAEHNTKQAQVVKKLKDKNRNARKRELRAKRGKKKVTMKLLQKEPRLSRCMLADLLRISAADLTKHGLVRIAQVRKGKKRMAEQTNELEWVKRRAKRPNARALSAKRQSQLTGTRGDRRHFTAKPLLLQVYLKREANMGAGRVKGALDIVCQHMFTTEVQESWASETTLLRAARLIYQIELVQLQEHLSNALYITIRWDLSPQAHKEMLAIFISASFLKADIPPEFQEAQRVTGSSNLDVFNFVLCLQQCANKRATTVVAALLHTLSLVGLTPHSMSKDGCVFVTADGGSENMPAITQLFTEEHGARVYCAAHALSLVFSWACNQLPGKAPSAKIGDLMTHRSVARAEKTVNIIRRNWQSWDVYTRKETGRSDSDPKPNQGVLCLLCLGSPLYPTSSYPT